MLTDLHTCMCTCQAPLMVGLEALLSALVYFEMFFPDLLRTGFHPGGRRCDPGPRSSDTASSVPPALASCGGGAVGVWGTHK